MTRMTADKLFLYLAISAVASCQSSVYPQGASCRINSGPHKSTRYKMKGSDADWAKQYLARAEKDRGNPEASAELVSDFLDQHWPITDNESAAVAGKTVLSLLSDPGRLGFDQPNWKRYETLGHLKAVEGVLEADTHTTVYLRGRKPHAIQIFRDGRVEVLDDTANLAEFSSYCHTDIRNHSTSEMALFDVEATGEGGREIYLAGKTIRVTPSELSLLRSGQPLSADHPLTLAMYSGSKAKVMYSNP